MFQCAAFDELHGDVGDAVVLAITVDGHDVGVVQLGDCLCLAAEALREGRVVGEKLRQDFDRHVAVERRLVCLVDRRHAALSQPLDQTISAEGVTDERILHPKRIALSRVWLPASSHPICRGTPPRFARAWLGRDLGTWRRVRPNPWGCRRGRC